MPISRLVLVVTAVTAGLAITACGAGGGGPIAAAQSGSGPAPGAVTFAKCMRGHGVPQFPDPGGPPPAGSHITLLDSQLPGTSDIHAPVFQAALKVCMKQFLGGHPRPPVSAAQKAAALKFAECMRADGVRNFPDPKFPGNRGIAIEAPAGVDASGPAYEHAQQVCGNP